MACGTSSKVQGKIGKVGQVEAAINFGVSPGRQEGRNATPLSGVAASDVKLCLESDADAIFLAQSRVLTGIEFSACRPGLIEHD